MEKLSEFVAPLSWTKEPPPAMDHGGWYAEGVGGHYHWIGATLWRVDDPFTFVASIASFADAKAWAQADHETRVLALLTDAGRSALKEPSNG